MVAHVELRMTTSEERAAAYFNEHGDGALHHYEAGVESAYARARRAMDELSATGLGLGYGQRQKILRAISDRKTE